MNLPVVLQVVGLALFPAGAFVLWGFGVCLLVVAAVLVVAGVVLEREHALKADDVTQLMDAVREYERTH